VAAIEERSRGRAPLSARDFSLRRFRLDDHFEGFDRSAPRLKTVEDSGRKLSPHEDPVLCVQTPDGLEFVVVD